MTRRLLATLLLTAGLLAAVPAPAEAATHTERHSVLFDPLGIWDAGVRVHYAWRYHSTRHGITSTDLWLRARCDFMESKAFTRITVYQLSRTDDSENVRSGDCSMHRRLHEHTTGKRARVQLNAHVRRNAAPDSDMRESFYICRNGGC